MNKLEKEKAILKAGIVLIIALAFIMPGSATFTKPLGPINEETPQKKDSGTIGRDIIFEDSFETYTDFVVDDFPPWTTFDGDQGPTWGVEGYTWPNASYVGSFMIFNPSQTTPPFSSYPAHTGQKYATCWDAQTAYAPNDDWLFTPQLTAGTFEDVSFWARSLNSQYGLERFTVGVSTTDTNPASFTKISPGTYIEAPITWTLYTYDISSYSGQNIYIGIHVVSNDAFAFFLDDFSVTGSGGVQPLVVDADGPYTASVREDIQFTGIATGGVGPYSWSWDFGNGDTSPQQNPVYAYDESGVFTVILTVTDSANPANVANDTTTATITCSIEIVSITGGFGITVTVKNNGTTNLTNISWKATVEGMFIFPKERSGMITTFGAGEEIKIRLIFIGIGKFTLTITAGCAEETIEGRIFFFIIPPPF